MYYYYFEKVVNSSEHRRNAPSIQYIQYILAILYSIQLWIAASHIDLVILVLLLGQVVEFNVAGIIKNSRVTWTANLPLHLFMLLAGLLCFCCRAAAAAAPSVVTVQPLLPLVSAANAAQPLQLLLPLLLSLRFVYFDCFVVIIIVVLAVMPFLATTTALPMFCFNRYRWPAYENVMFEYIVWIYRLFD